MLEMQVGGIVPRVHKKYVFNCLAESHGHAEC